MYLKALNFFHRSSLNHSAISKTEAGSANMCKTTPFLAQKGEGHD